MNIKINKKKYKYSKYDPKYIYLFKKEKSRLKKIIPDSKIEHVGSTSVPNLGGKAIVDIAVQIPSSKLKKTMKILENNNYEYKTKPLDKDRKFMQRIIKYGRKERRIHIHLIPSGSHVWEGMIKFRNFLRKNKEYRLKYDKVKKEGAKIAKGNREIYVRHKEAVMKEIWEKAKDFNE